MRLMRPSGCGAISSSRVRGLRHRGNTVVLPATQTFLKFHINDALYAAIAVGHAPCRKDCSSRKPSRQKARLHAQVLDFGRGSLLALCLVD